ncbi:VOC family protein [Olivibacter sp. SDN3]|uniref:VOC family protein n=1 Tax=Olivibacter sp. SDN3 TaxID=2764720 RepID=UPI0016511117|nr:VOC family protein [Olivibacter sp. SDN3]QNL48114.1 VOC family protein [Olivibacter sp. SDN3]
MELRIARHTNDLGLLIAFYMRIFDLNILGSFENHDGYDGVFLGKTDLDWHLEFTSSSEKIDFNFGEDDLLVFYPKTTEEYKRIMGNIEQHNIATLTPKNPYWEHNGIMIADPDGYRIVISDLRVKDFVHLH